MINYPLYTVQIRGCWTVHPFNNHNGESVTYVVRRSVCRYHCFQGQNKPVELLGMWSTCSRGSCALPDRSVNIEEELKHLSNFHGAIILWLFCSCFLDLFCIIVVVNVAEGLYIFVVDNFLTNSWNRLCPLIVMTITCIHILACHSYWIGLLTFKSVL